MVSPKVPNTKPHSPTMEKKLKAMFNAIFPRDKNKEKAREKEIADRQNAPKTVPTVKNNEAIDSILKTFENLDINSNKTKYDKPEIKKEEDEFDNFTIKVIVDDRRSEECRINSNSSTDSGIEVKYDVADILEKLTIKEKELTKEVESKDENKTKDKKEKKLRDVVIGRGPIKSRVSDYNAHPYLSLVDDSAYKQIHQINQQTLSGGQLIVVPKPTAPEPDDLTEAELAFNVAQANQNYQSQHTSNECLDDVISSITQDEYQTVLAVIDNMVLSNFEEKQPLEHISASESAPNSFNNVSAPKHQISNPIEEFSQHISAPSNEDPFDTNLFGLQELSPQEFNQDASIFLTPPRSEAVSSPMSESQNCYPSNDYTLSPDLPSYPSNYSLSPERSSPDNLDLEKYQEIKFAPEKRERTSSTSKTMKNFKDYQKEIANEFSKKDCCELNRKPCNEIFDEHLQRLKPVERRSIVLDVAKMDLKMAYGVLHHSLIALSRECASEDLHISLFALIAKRVLAQSPALFIGDFGLSILKAAALRCPQRPLLTRFIVECVYMVLRSDPKLCANDCVFHEVDAQGDNLVIACARGGDAFALVLAEIARSDIRGDIPSLFRVHHTNNDGYTALHVACRQHGASHSHLHVVHVLLEHAQADIWKGDIKGGDTAVHLAVNSASCDTALVMLLFKQIDRKEWKKLAHKHNMSTATPLEYARKATNSAARQNYPHEVLDFLKKCR